MGALDMVMRYHVEIGLLHESSLDIWDQFQSKYMSHHLYFLDDSLKFSIVICVKFSDHQGMILKCYRP